MRALAFAVAATLSFALVAACEEPEAAPASEMAVSPAAPAATERDEEEEIELLEGLPEELDIPVDEMDQAALETACFEGRQAACDRLGH